MNFIHHFKSKLQQATKKQQLFTQSVVGENEYEVHIRIRPRYYSY
ncbi:hypothetical protein [Aquimarina sp. U1-2]|nr:hypothetical protein [Aquimarina sp. U1-2]